MFSGCRYLACIRPSGGGRNSDRKCIQFRRRISKQRSLGCYHHTRPVEVSAPLLFAGWTMTLLFAGWTMKRFGWETWSYIFLRAFDFLFRQAIHAELTHLLLNEGDDANDSLHLERAFEFAVEEVESAKSLMSSSWCCSTEA